MEISALVKRFPVEVGSHFLQGAEANGMDDSVRIARRKVVERGLGELSLKPHHSLRGLVRLVHGCSTESEKLRDINEEVRAGSRKPLFRPDVIVPIRQAETTC